MRLRWTGFPGKESITAIKARAGALRKMIRQSAGLVEEVSQHEAIFEELRTEVDHYKTIVARNLRGLSEAISKESPDILQDDRAVSSVKPQTGRFKR